MAFELTDNNLLGAAVIDRPANAIKSAATFIDPYDYAMVYQPELVSKFHMRHGKGSILGFTRMTGSEGTYASDQIQHGEQNRLHTISKNVAVAGNVFTSPTDHQLRVDDVIRISDGTNEDQAIVTAVASSKVFTALSDTVAAFAFAGNVTLFSSSNRFAKGTENFSQGFHWDPSIYKNYSHILKGFYDINDSDRAHDTWLETPDGPMWFNYELSNNSRYFDNLAELTHLFHNRAADNAASTTAGKTRGMKGIIQQIEERGNVANEYIENIEDLADIAYRIKQQGGCTSYTIYADHTQMFKFNTMLAGVNAGFVNGANYGIFNNSKEMALALDFQSVSILGITFFITGLRVLDDPQFLGAEHFKTTAPAFIMVPAGFKSVTEDGATIDKAYLSIRYRKSQFTDRKKQVKLFGPGFTEHKKDTMEAHFTQEQLNQVIGANEYIVGRRNIAYT
ncbi:hypothetical protein [Flavobacterium caseinilyticum]|uniref:Major capsid protein n=1 Tax=Flavobacterium caseinilyticum TaxID=2541732 RepID=A0A4R5B269_9FLAO|nr:hypothetical protein [Flavobacterium caseinilyticum]TDD77132.1 hypothetical protein E0F89_05905 [Flavobacterium caseinilyticum]